MRIRRTVYWGSFPVLITLSRWEDALVTYHDSKTMEGEFNFSVFGRNSVQIMLADCGFIQVPPLALSVAKSANIPVWELIGTKVWNIDPDILLEALDRWADAIDMTRVAVIRYAIQSRLERMYSADLPKIIKALKNTDGRVNFNSEPEIDTRSETDSHFVDPYLTDEHWNKIYNFLLQHPSARPGDENSCRRFIEGAFYVLNSDNGWNQMPDRYGDYSGVFKCYKRWEEKGVWDAMKERFADDPELQKILPN